MRKMFMTIVLAIALAFSVSMSAQAQTNAHYSCENVANVAATLMAARQQGVPLSKVLEKVENVYVERLAIHAYQQTRYDSMDMKRKAVNHYREYWYIQCVRSKQQ